ncbi:MAG: MFS transporter [Flammeovirgaceae bacterium]
MTAASKKIYTPQFWLLCLSSVLFFASFNMIIPELPDYLSELGGPEYKGLIISLFTVTAMLSRPFSGKLADSLGRKPVIMFGAAVCILCSALYPLLSTVAGFLLLRLIHGFSTGFSPTGVAAYVSDIVPAERRGEAMGMVGTSGALGMAGGPALGGAVANQWGLDVMFYVSSFLALASIVIFIRVRETLKERHSVSWRLLKVSWADIYEPLVLAPCFVMMLTAYAYGTVYTMLPDFGFTMGIKNKGLLFVYFTLASLFIRLIAGRASDMYGRVVILRVSVVMIILAMAVIGMAQTKWMLVLGVCMYGLGQGSTSPTLLAWATDLSDENFRGRAIACFYICMEFGIGLGAFCAGLIFANDTSNFFITFAPCMILAAVAFVFLAMSYKEKIERRAIKPIS